jgi:DNA-binding NarL/FixJ family response regulator
MERPVASRNTHKGTSPGAIRLVLCEDAFLAREGITRVLDRLDGIELVASCGDLESVRAAVQRTEPDVVVTDIQMPPDYGDEGLRLAAELHASRPEIGVLVLGESAQAFGRDALTAAGAARRGYLLKDRLGDRRTIEQAIRDVAAGGALMDPRILESLLTGEGSPAQRKLAALTGREREIVELVAAGHTNAAIAGRLGITTRGVERHVNAIFAKLGPVDAGATNRRVHATLVYLTAAGRLSDAPEAVAGAGQGRESAG